MKQGQITIFLSLILTFLLSLVCTAIESVRIEGIMLQGESAVEMAKCSLLSNYQTDMLKKYDLFFLDGADKDCFFSESKLENCLADNLFYNLCPKNGLSGKRVSFLNSRASMVELSSYCLATDANGYEVYKQIIEYEANRLGVTMLEDLLKDFDNGEELISIGRNFEEEEELHQESIDRLEEENKNTENEFSQKDIQNNPLESLDECKASGILSLIMNSDTVSGKKINLEEMPSKRKILLGDGKKKADTIYGLYEDRALFGEYILEKFNHALSKEKGGTLDYEVEYILIGKDSDKKNLEGVLNELLLLREGVNYAYLHTDKAKVSEAEALALALVGFTGVAPVVTAMRELLLLGWAYAESVKDLQSLMAGGKLALIKTSNNWQTGLHNIGKPEMQKGKKREETGGLSYEGYLRLLLGIKGGKKKVMATIDLIENHIRSIEGKSDFRMDCCFSKCNYKILYTAKPLFLGLSTGVERDSASMFNYTFKSEGTLTY